MANYKPVERGQGYFLTITPSEQFEEHSLEKLISRFVDEEIDIGSFSEKYRNDTVGQKAIHPAVKLKVVFYSFSKGIESSRKAEEMMRMNHLGYVYLSGNRVVDHSTLCHFINDFSGEIAAMYARLLAVMNELGMIDWSKIVIDGTKISSNASRRLTSDAVGFKEKMKRYKELSKKLVARSTYIDELENEGKIEGEKAAKERETMERQKREYERVIQKIKAYEKGVTEGKIEPKEKINLTDRESKLLKDQDGFQQGYNVQAAYSTNDIIVAIEAENQNDKVLLEQMIKNVEKRKEQNGVQGESRYLQDKGYFNPRQVMDLLKEGKDMYGAVPKNITRNWLFTGEQNVEIREEGVFLVCAGGKRKRGYYDKHEDEYKFEMTRRDCEGCGKKKECWKHVKEEGKKKRFTVARTFVEDKEQWEDYFVKMSSIDGVMTYNKRIGKEHNFHDLKSYEGIRRLLRRGKQKCNTEVMLAAIGHNFKKFQKIMSYRAMIPQCMA